MKWVGADEVVRKGGWWRWVGWLLGIRWVVQVGGVGWVVKMSVFRWVVKMGGVEWVAKMGDVGWVVKMGGWSMSGREEEVWSQDNILHFHI